MLVNLNQSLTVVATHRVQSLLYLKSMFPILTSPTQLSSAQASRSAPSITILGLKVFCVTSRAMFPGSRDLYYHHIVNNVPLKDSWQPEILKRGLCGHHIRGHIRKARDAGHREGARVGLQILHPCLSLSLLILITSC